MLSLGIRNVSPLCWSLHSSKHNSTNELRKLSDPWRLCRLCYLTFSCIVSDRSDHHPLDETRSIWNGSLIMFFFSIFFPGYIQAVTWSRQNSFLFHPLLFGFFVSFVFFIRFYYFNFEGKQCFVKWRRGSGRLYCWWRFTDLNPLHL